ncbi:unnamed protein product [Penicillium manginii]
MGADNGSNESSSACSAQVELLNDDLLSKIALFASIPLIGPSPISKIHPQQQTTSKNISQLHLPSTTSKMKFTAIASALFLATAAMATPDIDVDSIVSQAEGIATSAKSAGESIGSDAAAEATSIGHAFETGGSAALSTLTGEAASIATAVESHVTSIVSGAESVGSDAASKASAWVSTFTSTNSDGEKTTGASTITSRASTATNTGASTTGSESASPTTSNAAVAGYNMNAAAAGMAGILGVMVAL